MARCRRRVSLTLTAPDLGVVTVNATREVMPAGTRHYLLTGPVPHWAL
jgi:hypothetical protein